MLSFQEMCLLFVKDKNHQSIESIRSDTENDCRERESWHSPRDVDHLHRVGRITHMANCGSYVCGWLCAVDELEVGSSALHWGVVRGENWNVLLRQQLMCWCTAWSTCGSIETHTRTLLSVAGTCLYKLTWHLFSSPPRPDRSTCTIEVHKLLQTVGLSA